MAIHPASRTIDQSSAANGQGPVSQERPGCGPTTAPTIEGPCGTCRLPGLAAAMARGPGRGCANDIRHSQRVTARRVGARRRTGSSGALRSRGRSTRWGCWPGCVPGCLPGVPSERDRGPGHVPSPARRGACAGFGRGDVRTRADAAGRPGHDRGDPGLPDGGTTFHTGRSFITPLQAADQWRCTWPHAPAYGTACWPGRWTITPPGIGAHRVSVGSWETRRTRMFPGAVDGAHIAKPAGSFDASILVSGPEQAP